MEAYKEIEGIPKSKSALAALGSTSMNAAGGFLAGRLRGVIAGTGYAPSTKGGMSILIFFIAAGLKYWARNEKGWDRVVKEFAAGAAGFVGNDMWFVLRGVFGWGKWKPETAYKTGDIVLHGKEYYKADKDIAATPTAEPGKDSRWVKFETAQGVTISEITEFAQALRSNDVLLDGIVKEQLLIFGPELAQAMGRDLNQDEANNIYSGMRDSLKSVVIKFAEG
jgi:hypothetical protein